MSSKKLGVVGGMAFVLTACGLLLAQDSKAPRSRHTLPAGYRTLKLDSAQRTKIYAIEDAYRGKIDALRQQISDLQKKERAEMFAVLTDAQKQQLREAVTGKEGAGDATGDKAQATKKK